MSELTLFDPPADPLNRSAEIVQDLLCFTVYGKPIAQGSKRGFVVNGRNQPDGKKGKPRAIVTESNSEKLLPWRQQISRTALSLGSAVIPRHAGVVVYLDFYFQRPESVSEKKRPHHTTYPDMDKLIRAVFDALTGTVVTDDAQICDCRVRKFYGLPERVEVRIGEIR